MKVDELLQYLKEHGQELRQSLLKNRYRPQAVRRVEISKLDGGKRLLGIPTVDRPWKLKFLGVSFYRSKGEYACYFNIAIYILLIYELAI